MPAAAVIYFIIIKIELFKKKMYLLKSKIFNQINFFLFILIIFSKKPRLDTLLF